MLTIAKKTIFFFIVWNPLLTCKVTKKSASDTNLTPLVSRIGSDIYIFWLESLLYFELDRISNSFGLESSIIFWIGSDRIKIFIYISDWLEFIRIGIVFDLRLARIRWDYNLGLYIVLAQIHLDGYLSSNSDWFRLEIVWFRIGSDSPGIESLVMGRIGSDLFGLKS